LEVTAAGYSKHDMIQPRGLLILLKPEHWRVRIEADQVDPFLWQLPWHRSIFRPVL